jgi:phage shock protein E
MFKKIKKLLGIERPTDFKRLFESGAKIIDVRTPSEYSAGHIPDSVNIPLNLLSKRIVKIAKDQQIILCCASGMRSSSARGELLSMGYLNVYDGGRWNSLLAKIR